MKTVKKFGDLAVRDLMFRLRYRSFGSLMPDRDTLVEAQKCYF
jgi:hypothetical protein